MKICIYYYTYFMLYQQYLQIIPTIFTNRRSEDYDFQHEELSMERDALSMNVTTVMSDNQLTVTSNYSVYTNVPNRSIINVQKSIATCVTLSEP